MSDIRKIFLSRIEKENTKRATYNKYIFNSHLVMFLMVSVGAAMFNYSKWLKTASSLQLYIFLFLVLSLMSYFLTMVKVKTFVRRADSVFILPLESKYKDIISSLVQSSVILNIIISILAIVVIYPLSQVLEISKIRLLHLFISLLISSIFITLLKQYKVIYDKLSNKDLGIISLIYLANITYFIFLDYFNVSFILALVYYMYVKKNLTFNINWQGAAEYDEVRNEKYLKFVNMFTDVPMDSVKVARRKYLDIITPKLNQNNFAKENTYNYYYVRAFFRQENSIFLLIRLFLVAVLFIYGLKNIYASSFIIVAFNYLTLIQLIPLYKKLNASLWFYVLPVAEDIKIKSFRKMMTNIMFVASILLMFIALLILGIRLDEVLYLGLGVLISLLLNRYFLQKIR